ncbi:alpha-amylase family glycosyl hydrolase [Sandaracinus amylolyticus]|uniref:alpha-amylase family glycosyl hydrolase n=1 Tax=Sandaracinus amylolyticus TaxID=927083 RepID=UPI001EEC2714|nr:alpha-amylase family glycosyl hydrolase [Sandaracinus amylolyticus]
MPTHASEVSVVLVAPDGTRRVRALPRVRPGLHEAVVAGIGAGTRYLLRIDDREVPDPFARSLPEGPYAPAEVLPPRSPSTPRRPIDMKRAPVIYELHVGTFTREGTFAAAREKLPHLVELGVDAIELMPVASFPGARGWGYDGVALLAPHAAYGGPDELASLVDEAHRLRLSVLLDVVLNHFGPDANWLPAIDPSLFDEDEPTPWGAAPRFSHPAMRALAREVLRLYVVEYGFDGLRLDATHAIVDRSATHVIAELSQLARGMPGPPVLIAEDERRDPMLFDRLRLDATWADDFHHAVHVLLTGERDGYYAPYEPTLSTLADVLRAGWRGPTHGDRERLVYCLENHDQTGNRAMGDRFWSLARDEDARAATLLAFFAPSSVLLFQGQEWGTRVPFLYFTDHEPELGAKVSEGRRAEFAEFPAFRDPAARARIPDPQDQRTFERGKLDWSERDRAPHDAILALHRAAIALRRSDPVLCDPSAELQVARHGEMLIVTRALRGARRVLAWNLGHEPRELRAGGRVLLASREDALHEMHLAARCAVILAC